MRREWLALALVKQVSMSLCVVLLLRLIVYGEEADERVEKAKQLVAQMAAGEFDKAVGRRRRKEVNRRGYGQDAQ